MEKPELILYIIEDDGIEDGIIIKGILDDGDGMELYDYKRLERGVSKAKASYFTYSTNSSDELEQVETSVYKFKLGKDNLKYLIEKYPILKQSMNRLIDILQFYADDEKMDRFGGKTVYNAKNYLNFLEILRNDYPEFFL